ncbi:MAG TPA: NAD-dependent epimerase/dehydratase family protein [Saprospiraceae bacterium]|nr:NAD-dependent epimerase/dehydratase family protein [Saprospiraceae bacterium]
MHAPTIFITGATGLLGSHLTRLLLARGYDKIIAVRRKNSRMDLLGEAADRIEWVSGDILDNHALQEGMQNADWVFHSAGLISYHPGDAGNMHAINVGGTANVVNAALLCGVGKLLHISSVSVLARSGRYQNVSESTPWQHTRYTSNYGLTKHLAEKEVQRGIAEGLNASILIPSIILGAGVWHEGSASIYHRIGKGMPIYPRGQNGYVDVRDVALLAIRMMEQDQKYRVIASGHTIGYRELFSEIAQRLDAPVPKVAVGPVVSEVVWRLMVPIRWTTGKQPVINKETTRAAQCFPEYDNSASLKVPGFRYTPLEKTLDDIAREYQLARKKRFAPGFLDFNGEYLI